jgi:hypothetical protein
MAMTWDPFQGWNRMVAAGASMVDTQLRALQMLNTAGEVIAARSTIIGEALASPMTGDYAEMQRMVPEKIEAFARAGVAGATALHQAQADWIAQVQRLAARGRPPAPHELAQIAASSAEALARVGSTTLAPVHRRVTANARRLKRRNRAG